MWESHLQLEILGNSRKSCWILFWSILISVQSSESRNLRTGLNKCNLFHQLEETLSCKAGVTKRWQEGSASSVQGCYSPTVFIVEFRQSLNFSSKCNPVSWLMACIFVFLIERSVRALEHWLWNFYHSLSEEKESILLLRNIALLIIAHIVLYVYVCFYINVQIHTNYSIYLCIYLAYKQL